METHTIPRRFPKFSLRGALKRLGVLAKNAKTDKNLVQASANLSKVTATAGVLTATGFITQASFAAIAVVVGSAAIGTTGGTIIPVIGGLVFLSGFLAEKLSMRDNLRVTMILIHKESKRMQHIINIINKDSANIKHISFDVYNAMLYELNAFIMSMMTKEQLSELGINNQKGISSLNRYFSTFVSPGSFMNVLLERLSRATSAFTIVVAEYTISKHGEWKEHNNTSFEIENTVRTVRPVNGQNGPEQNSPVPEQNSSVPGQNSPVPEQNSSVPGQAGGDNTNPLGVLQAMVDRMANVDEDVKKAASAADNLQKAGEVADAIENAAGEESHQVHHGGFYTKKRVKKGVYNKL